MLGKSHGTSSVVPRWEAYANAGETVMSEPLFEIESWRGAWYYKLGSRYTGPFKRRESAVAAARVEVDPLLAPKSSSLRASLAGQRPSDLNGRGIDSGKPEHPFSFGMSFRIPGVGGHA